MQANPEVKPTWRVRRRVQTVFDPVLFTVVHGDSRAKT